ncbi:MAG TPA: hypothetical protein PK867_00725 [Pirellulales bacterium]|nr:hypothetical protein [Pirellulales bacterium]
MWRTALTGAVLACLWSPMSAAAQDYDEDDPVRYDWSNRDYYENGKNFGSAWYPRYENRDSPVARRNDNRDYGQRRYPPAHRGDRYSRNYGLPPLDQYSSAAPKYDDPDPFDNAYGRQRGPHYIAPEAENFRGGRYATDYPGFRGGWYGRDHHIRIRAGQYTAGDFANAYWDHPHHARGYPGEHTWNWTSGQAY